MGWNGHRAGCAERDERGRKMLTGEGANGRNGRI